MSARILYITHRTPWPPDRGDRIRSWNILKFLAGRAEIDLLCLADEPVTEECLSELRKVTRRLQVVPLPRRGRYGHGLFSLLRGKTITEGMFYSREAMQILKEWSAGGGWDSVIASSSGVARFTAPEHTGPVSQRWIDLTDVDSQKWLDYSRSSAFPKSLLYGWEGNRLRALEKQLARDCDRLLVVSEAERRLFLQFCSTDRIHAVGNGVDTDYFASRPLPEHPSQVCVFVGVMNYLPNVDAVRWFASEVWPEVRQRHPGAVFRIVGKSPTSDVRRLSVVPGIEVTGAVPDVRPSLYEADCAVVPLRIARGVQNKVLEAMACGRPVICSTAPLNGLRADCRSAVVEANSADEWIAAVGRVLEDAALRNELGLAAGTWVRMHHGWDACLEPLLRLTERSENERAETHRRQEAAP